MLKRVFNVASRASQLPGARARARVVFFVFLLHTLDILHKWYRQRGGKDEAHPRYRPWTTLFPPGKFEKDSCGLVVCESGFRKTLPNSG